MGDVICAKYFKGKRRNNRSKFSNSGQNSARQIQREGKEKENREVVSSITGV